MSPCFAVQVPADTQPKLDHAHDALRWVPRDHVDRTFMWPGQRTAIQQITRDLLPHTAGQTSLIAKHLQIKPD